MGRVVEFSPILQTAQHDSFEWIRFIIRPVEQ